MLSFFHSINIIFIHFLSENPIEKFGDDIRNALFPNLPTFIAHVIATIILLTIISVLGYKPFKKAQNEKFNYIKKQIEDANMKFENSLIKENEASNTLKKAHLDFKNIITNAKQSAENIKNKNKLIIQEQTKKMIFDAENDIIRQKEKMESKVNSKIINLSFIVAEKIINREIDEKENSKLVDNFLKSVVSNDKK